uniref:Uncharacterized protein n=1 Tax=Knipowitschia caucasica TaxID=637954 RepID=A0AAV2KYE1_KNICA
MAPCASIRCGPAASPLICMSKYEGIPLRKKPGFDVAIPTGLWTKIDSNGSVKSFISSVAARLLHLFNQELLQRENRELWPQSEVNGTGVKPSCG